jgi:hypothetical protein
MVGGQQVVRKVASRWSVGTSRRSGRWGQQVVRYTLALP